MSQQQQTKQENFELIHDFWFNMTEDQRFEFIEINFKIKTGKGVVIPLRLAEFQRKWFLDGPLFNDFRKMTSFWNRICLKPRGIGASYILSGIEAVITAWVYPKIKIPIVAGREEQATDLVGYCKDVLELCEFIIPLTGALKDQSSMLVKFANGSTIKSYPGGNPEGVRGPRSPYVIIDEAAYLKYPQEILNAVGYFVSEGGMISMLSTIRGKNNLFWKYWDERENFKNWHRHYVPLFTDMSRFDISKSLIYQRDTYGLVLSAPWLSIEVLEAKRVDDVAYNYANFSEEVLGIPVQEVSSAFPDQLVNMLKSEFYEYNERPNATEMDKERTFVIGIDFGATKNVTACVVVEAVDGLFKVCHTETYLGNIVDQITSIKDLVFRFAPKFVVGDATGMGGQSFIDILSEILGEGVVIPVNYSKKDFGLEFGIDMINKNFMVNSATKLFADGRLCIPNNHLRLRKELLAIEKIVYEKSVKFSGKEGVEKSDDLAFAFLQACLMYNRIYSMDSAEKSVFADTGHRLTRSGFLEKPKSVTVSKSIEAGGANDNKTYRKEHGYGSKWSSYI